MPHETNVDMILDWTRLRDQAAIGAERSKEGDLLRQLALAEICQRAGLLLPIVKVPKPGDAPPLEVLPVCSNMEMGLLLHRSLHGGKTPVILTWFWMIARYGKRIRHEDIHYVLTLPNQHVRAAAYIRPVIGTRGEWILANSKGFEAFHQVDNPLPGLNVELEMPVIPAEQPDLIKVRDELIAALERLNS